MAALKTLAIDAEHALDDFTRTCEIAIPDELTQHLAMALQNTLQFTDLGPVINEAEQVHENFINHAQSVAIVDPLTRSLAVALEGMLWLATGNNWYRPDGFEGWGR